MIPAHPGRAVPATGSRVTIARLRRSAVWLLAAVIVLIGAGLLAALYQEFTAPATANAHHDFLAFYGAGELVLRGHAAQLYDAGAMTTAQRAIIPYPVGYNGYMPFINPPFVATAFAPLAALPYTTARAAWAVINLVLAAVAAVWVAHDLPPRQRALGGLLMVLSFPIYHALAEGQVSIVLLVASLAALFAARRGAWGATGAWLAVLWIKPQFLVLPLLALLFARRWRTIAWVVGLGAAMLAVSLPFTGAAIDVQYVGYLVNVVVSHFTGAGVLQHSVWEGNLATTEGLNGLLVGFMGQGSVGLVNILWALLAAGLLGLYGLAVLRQRPGFDSPGARRMLAAGVVVVLLTDPNLFTQDCVLLFVAVLALWPVNPRHALGVITAAAAIGELTLLDQGTLTPHLFTVVLLLIAVAVCVAEVVARPVTARVVAETA